MNIIDIMNLENWKLSYKLSKSNSENVNHKTFVIINEVSGTKTDLQEKSVSERDDYIIFIPMIILNISNNNISSEVLAKIESNFYNYIPGCFPTTYDSMKFITAEIQNFNLIITVQLAQKVELITIKLSEKEYNFLINNSSLSLAVNIGHKNYIGRVNIVNFTTEMPSFFIKKNFSITQSNALKALPSMMDNINRQEKGILIPSNNYLDIDGSSDYDIYQSTESAESLPSLKNLSLGDFCYACGKREVTREHCSPKWMTDHYGVKPLIGTIFCSDCNQLFGKRFEEFAKEKLKIHSNFMSDEQRRFIAKWCTKTAVTMSLASGVQVDNTWLSDLKSGKIPDGIEVYFDPRTKLLEKGFNYGVSRFNKSLSKKRTFLFTFLCQDFIFVVVKKNKNRSLQLPFYKIFPNFEYPKSNPYIDNFADEHQKIHELLSGEKTIDFSLPIRKNN